MKKRFRLATVICAAALAILILSGCGSGFNEDALHINYDEASVYGSEDYLGVYDYHCRQCY